jgi:Uma2 family endonuclease
MATVRVKGDRLTSIDINPVDGLDHYLMAVAGQRRQGRIKCDGRSILRVSPGQPHESSSFWINLFLLEVFDAFDREVIPMASTLFRPAPPDRNQGIEPDHSYYLANAAKVVGVTSVEIDMSLYPPPDLMLEIVDSHPAKQALAVCLRLRVPEVWVYWVRSRRMKFKGLVEEPGKPPRYQDLPRSRVLPMLTPDDVAPWAAPTGEHIVALKRRARAWAEARLQAVRDGLMPGA